MQGFDWAATEAVFSVTGAIGVVISIIFSLYEIRRNLHDLVGCEVGEAYAQALDRHMQTTGFRTTWDSLKIDCPTSVQHATDTRFDGPMAMEV